MGADLGGPAGSATVRAAEGLVTLVEGRTFCLSAANGDIVPGLTQGLFVLDTRVLSRWELRINGQPVEGLSVDVEEPYAGRFVGRSHPAEGRGDSDLVVFRRRLVGRGMSEEITVANHGTEPMPVTIDLVADADLAGIFDVKSGRAHAARPRSRRADGHALTIADDADATTSVRISGSEPAAIEDGRLTWQRTVGSGERWPLCCDVQVALVGAALEARFPCGASERDTVPAQRLSEWRTRLPEVRTGSDELDAVVLQSGEDLGALRIFDPERPDVPVLAAGVPWYMTVFGRDSLLTAWMALLGDRRLATGVLDTLARFQGDDVVPATDEEPGKVLHEIRLELSAGPSLSHADIYYGSIDATPLFVALLGEVRRWGLADDELDRLLPHADRALEWVEHFGDRDGDGYVEYQRASPSGLANQGWKDSWDGVRGADGRFPEGPIALCEVQGYVYAAFRARAELAEQRGDDATARRCTARAGELRRRFDEDFWLPDRGWFALALDGDKRPVDGLASNMGHCLWSGIVAEERAAQVAEALLSPELFSGWGVRTLATSMRAFNPVSYHNGSVWPHDNALLAAGLVRYGFHDAAHRIIRAQLDVATRLDRRLPELFAGFDRSDFRNPVAYPSSCSPQAWAAAAPLQWLTSLLGLRPDVPRGRLALDPVLPDWLGPVSLRGVRIGDAEVSVEVDASGLQVDGADGFDGP